MGVADLINQWVKGSPDTNDKGSKAAVSLSKINGSLNLNLIAPFLNPARG